MATCKKREKNKLGRISSLERGTGLTRRRETLPYSTEPKRAPQKRPKRPQQQYLTPNAQLNPRSLFAAAMDCLSEKWVGLSQNGCLLSSAPWRTQLEIAPSHSSALPLNIRNLGATAASCGQKDVSLGLDRKDLSSPNCGLRSHPQRGCLDCSLPSDHTQVPPLSLEEG